jgi:hypothetical protein
MGVQKSCFFSRISTAINRKSQPEPCTVLPDYFENPENNDK